MVCVYYIECSVVQVLLTFIKALLYTVSVEYECVFWTSNECSA